MEMLKVENGGFLSDESRLLEELRAENLLLTLQNENKQLHMEVGGLAKGK